MPSPPEIAQPFHLMAKPSGSACNLDCTYCFYLEKQALYHDSRQRMGHDVLEGYIRSYIESLPPDAPVQFAWQGGEPTLMGLDFFREAMALQRQYGAGRSITNALQTNGVLLTEDWCRFLADHKFLVGLSLDGPAHIHDRYRIAKDGSATHAAVVRALRLLQRFGVEHNVLACVNRVSAQHPLEVYRFLRDLGVEFVQFIPIVERPPDAHYVQLGLSLCGPARTPTRTASPANPTVTEWSVLPQDYGTFLWTIFQEWVRHDVGRMFVMNFEWALAAYMNVPGAVCVHQETCGRAAIIEHNGDVYSCDHFVYPEYRLGNVRHMSLAAMMDSAAQHAFGNAKRDTLTRQCRECKVLRACWGGCPKQRFTTSEHGEPGQHYLCRGYYHFFSSIVPYLQAFAFLIQSGRGTEEIMNMKITAPPSQGSAHENA